MTKLWHISVMFILVLPALPFLALLAQTTAPSLPGDPATKSSTQEAQRPSAQENQSQQPSQPKSPLPPPQEQNSGQPAPDQPGNISGTVTDVNDDAVVGATVVLQGPVTSDGQTVITNDNGFFEIRDVTPGISYDVTISASGFANWTSVFMLDPGQYKILDVSKLRVEEVQTTVTVSPETG